MIKGSLEPMLQARLEQMLQPTQLEIEVKQ